MDAGLSKEVVSKSTSRIQICEGASIDKVVSQYDSNFALVVKTKPSDKRSSVVTQFPSGEDVGHIGFVSSPLAGSTLLKNDFSPLSKRVVQIGAGSFFWN